MSKSIGAPNGVERRAYRISDSTANNLPAAEHTQKAELSQGQPFREVSDRGTLVEILQTQIDLALERDYPLCVGLLRICKGRTDAATFEKLLRTIRHNLRPSDIVLQIPGPVIGVVLHEADILGGRAAFNRTNAIVAGDQELADLRLEYGLCDRLMREPSRAESMLRTAERDLERQ